MNPDNPTYWLFTNARKHFAGSQILNQPLLIQEEHRRPANPYK